MPLKAFLPDTVITDGATQNACAVLVEGPRVRALVPRGEVPADAVRVALPGLTLAPGLVDGQVNGGGGVLFNDQTDEKGLAAIEAAHRRAGTTALLPTLISDTPEKMAQAIAAVAAFRAARTEKTNQTGVIGLHLEGPFLNPACHGIHAPENIAAPALSFLDHPRLKEAGKILLTLAPERFTPPQLRALSAAGLLLSAGHSAADKKTLEGAKQAGLTGITHLYNGMGGGLRARAPGLAGLALLDDALACSLIADGVHVSAEMVQLAFRLKPPGKLFFVSDAMPPAGQAQKSPFRLQGKAIFVHEDRCLDGEGNLAGSALTLFECVRIAHRQMGLPLPACLAMASQFPARFLGLEGEMGSLTPHARADMIAFDDTLTLQKVFVGGEAV